MVSLKDSYSIIRWDGVNSEKLWFEEDLKDAVSKLIKYKKSCMYDIKENYDKYNSDEVNSYYERKRANRQFETDLKIIKEIFGDWDD